MNIREWKRVAGSFKKRFAARALILQYHRVIDLPSDPYTVAITPRHFTEHLSVLRKFARPVRLAEVFSELSLTKGLPVVVTFDDGYYDLFSHAKPLLEHYDVPATIFVTSGFVGAQREFWWDALEKILLEPGTLPAELSLPMMAGKFEWRLDGENVYPQQDFQRYRHWHYGERVDPTPRHTLFRSLYRLLQPVSEEEKCFAIDKLARWAGIQLQERPSHRPLSIDELVRLAAADGIEIGAHTMTHPVLSQLSSDAQQHEIQGSKKDLERLLGRSVQSFSYPHGLMSHYTVESVTLVRDAGYKLACSSCNGFINSRTDPLQIPRFVVRDCDGDEFAKQLIEWCS